MSATSPKRILLLMDNRGDSNWGSRATTSCLVSLIRERFPSAEVRGVGRGAANAVRNYRTLADRVAPSATLGTFNPIANLIASLSLRDLRPLIGWPDLVIVNGEGTIHPNPQARIWMMMIARFLQKSAARLWFVNGSIRLGEGATRAAFQHVLKGAERIAVREMETYDHLLAAGFEPISSADAAFLAKPSDGDAVADFLNRHRIEGPFAILTGSASAATWPVESVRNIVGGLQNQGLSAVFCSSTTTDAKLAMRAAPELPRFAYPEFDYPEFIALIGRAAIHIGGRYHPTLFAAMQGVPLLALGTNTSKIKGALRIMELPEDHLASVDDSSLPSRIAATLESPKPSIKLSKIHNLARRNIFDA